MRIRCFRGAAFHFERFGVKFSLYQVDDDDRNLDILQGELTQEQEHRIKSAYKIEDDGRIICAFKCIGTLSLGELHE